MPLRAPPEQNAQRFQQAAANGDQHNQKDETGGALAKRHRQSLGYILQGDGGSERQPSTCPLGEVSPDGHAFRQVVQTMAKTTARPEATRGQGRRALSCRARGGELIKTQHQQDAEVMPATTGGGGEESRHL